MVWYKFITKLVIPLIILNMLSWMKEKGVDFLGQYIGVYLSFSICVANKRWRTATHRRFWQVFLIGGHTILHLLTCEISYTHTFQHTSGTPHTWSHIHSSKTIHCHQALHISEILHCSFKILQQIYIPSLRYRCFWFQINLLKNWDDQISSQDKISTISSQSRAGIIWSLRYVHCSICRNIQRSLNDLHTYGVQQTSATSGVTCFTVFSQSSKEFQSTSKRKRIESSSLNSGLGPRLLA